MEIDALLDQNIMTVMDDSKYCNCSNFASPTTSQISDSNDGGICSLKEQGTFIRNYDTSTRYRKSRQFSGEKRTWVDSCWKLMGPGSVQYVYINVSSLSPALYVSWHFKEISSY